MGFIVKFINFLLYVLLGLGIVGAGVVVWGMAVEPNQIQITRQHMALAGMPRTWPNLKVAVLSDLHVGSPHVDLAKLEEIVDIVNSQNPDVVLLLGDFLPDVFFSQSISPKDFAPVLGKLAPKFGIAAVLGEHDLRGDTTALVAELQKAKIPVLRNSAIRLDLGKQRRLWVAGLDNDGPDYKKAAAKVPADSPVLVLVHNPAAFPDIPLSATGVFAGHSHGGLINVPEYGPLILSNDVPLRYTRGIIKEDAKVMFVTTGIGTGAYPIRVNNRPEIAILAVGVGVK